MRILLLSPAGAGTHYFGPGMSAYRLYSSDEVEGDRDISVSLLHGYRDQEKLDLFDEQYYIPEYSKRGFLSGIRFLLGCRQWIKKNAHKFDVVHCMGMFYYSFIPAIWFEDAGVPVFIKVTINLEKGFSESSLPAKMFGLERFRRSNMNKITCYISISQAITRMLIREGISEERVRLIPDGVDIDRFFPAGRSEKTELRRSLGISDKFTVLFTGDFSNRKNPLVATEAYGYLKDIQDSVQLLLVGPDRPGENQRERIFEFVEKNGLTNVIVKGHVTDIERYYRASDMFILPSVNEGLSNSMLEAQSCGLPALVTNISGAEDLVEESVNGSFIERDAEMIAERIRYYVENPDLLEQNSINSRNRIVKDYNSKTTLRKHLELFRMKAG